MLSFALTPMDRSSFARVFRARVVFTLLATWFALTVVVALEKPAMAQTVTVADPTFRSRVDAAGKPVLKRANENYPEGVNYDDCKNDVRLQIPITMSGYDTSMTMQVWATADGADCTQSTNRTNTQVHECYRIYPGVVPLTNATTVSLRAQDIIAKTQAMSNDYVNANASICGTVDQTKFTVYFIFVKGGGDSAGSANFDVDADTIGPVPVSGLKVQPGDTRLTVSWNGVGSDEAGASSAQSVVVYYAPSGPGSTAASDASASSSDAGTRTITFCPDASASMADADTDASTTEDAGCRTITIPAGSSGGGVTGSCTAPGFKADGSEPDPSVSKKGLGTGATQTLLEGLTNGVTYAVGIAATDLFLNVGPVSSLTCETPIVLDDFFEVYRKAGGQAGGGLCALEAPGAPGAPIALTIGMVFMIASVVRRRPWRNRSGRTTKGDR
jgi:hypothetical protein